MHTHGQQPCCRPCSESSVRTILFNPLSSNSTSCQDRSQPASKYAYALCNKHACVYAQYIMRCTQWQNLPLGPHAVEPVQAKLQKIAPRPIMVKETSGQGHKIVVFDKDFWLLIHAYAHDELFQLELDANAQEVHCSCLVLSHEELLSSKCVLQQLESFGGDRLGLTG
jgi:hypothetical protein